VIEAIETSATTAAALARLHDYLRRAPQATPEQEEIARDAFVEGFRYGARWAVFTTASLADPQLKKAIEVLADALRAREP
jgi:hypothetical protein